MINIIKHEKDNVVAFELIGNITKDEFDEIVMPEVKKLVEKIDKLNLVYHINTKLENFTMGAWWKDAMLGIKNLSKWNKAAIVTDNENIQNFTDMFSKVMPGEFRGFDENNLEEALYWAAS